MAAEPRLGRVLRRLWPRHYPLHGHNPQRTPRAKASAIKRLRCGRKGHARICPLSPQTISPLHLELLRSAKILLLRIALESVRTVKTDDVRRDFADFPLPD